MTKVHSIKINNYFIFIKRQILLETPRLIAKPKNETYVRRNQRPKMGDEVTARPLVKNKNNVGMDHT